MGEHFKKINPIDDETWKRVQEMIDNPPEDLITSDPSRPYEGEQCVDVELAHRMYEEKVNDPAYSVYKFVTSEGLQDVVRRMMDKSAPVKSASGLFSADGYSDDKYRGAFASRIHRLAEKGGSSGPWITPEKLPLTGNDEAWYRLIRDMIKQQSDSIQDDLLFNSRNNLKI